MTFKKGQKVSVLDDAINGVVAKVHNGNVTIITTEGFELEFKAHELILEQDETMIRKDIFNTDFQKVIVDKEMSKKPGPTFKTKSKETEKMVVDLHIHQLVENTKHMENFDMLNLQLDTAKRRLEFAISKRMPHIVFIHGVGEGVLKMELHTLLRRYDNITFYDADYKIFGLGATEVRIFQNVAPN